MTLCPAVAAACAEIFGGSGKKRAIIRPTSLAPKRLDGDVAIDAPRPSSALRIPPRLSLRSVSSHPGATLSTSSRTSADLAGKRPRSDAAKRPSPPPGRQAADEDPMIPLLPDQCGQRLQHGLTFRASANARHGSSRPVRSGPSGARYQKGRKRGASITPEAESMHLIIRHHRSSQGCWPAWPAILFCQRAHMTRRR